MPKPKLIIYSDFICPFCYIGKVNMERAKEAFPDLEIEWREFELHPEGQPDPNSPYMQQAYEAVKKLADQYDIDMKPEVLIQLTSDSHKALLGLVFAKDHGKEVEYREAVFRAYWKEGRDIGNLDVLTSIAREVGLNSEAFAREVEMETGLARLQEAREEAMAHGINGVPTFVYGDMKSVGAQPPEILKRMIRIQDEKNALGQSNGMHCGPDSCK
jgi:predicted DsbA family dithiol-disulfide isomerase